MNMDIIKFKCNNCKEVFYSERGNYLYGPCPNCERGYLTLTSNKVIISQDLINENIKAVEEGRELTVPLAMLDGRIKHLYIRDQTIRITVKRCTECPNVFETQHNKLTCSNKCRKKRNRRLRKTWEEKYPEQLQKIREYDKRRSKEKRILEKLKKEQNNEIK